MILDLLIENARVVTMDPTRPTASSIGIWNGRIVGLDDDIAGLRAKSTTDLGGATVVPGFIDAHTHLAWTGMSARAVDIAGLDRDAALSRIGEAAAAVAPAAWVDVAGYDQRPIGGHLTRQELDRIGGGRKIYLQHVSGHVCVVSSSVLDLVPADVLASDLTGLDRDDLGDPTGLLEEGAMSLARTNRMPYSVEEIAGALDHSSRVALSQGVTSVADAGVGGGLATFSPVDAAGFQHAAETGRLPIRVQLMVVSDAVRPVTAHPDDRIARAIDLGLRTGFGGDRLSLGAMKLWTDGGMMARTAAMSAPYVGSDDPGQLAAEPEELIQTIVDGHGAGWQLAVHAIGDAAVDVALDGIERAQRLAPRADSRPRIEHAGAVRPDQLERMARLGVIAVIQPTFLWLWGDDYSAVLGEERAPWLYRGRGFVDHGILVAGSSDRPVSDGAPLRAMQFMVERLAASGALVGPGEQLTAAEALAAYTVNSAFACRAERSAGSITPGKHADLAVLSAGPTEVDPSAIAEIEVLATYVGGEIAYER